MTLRPQATLLMLVHPNNAIRSNLAYDEDEAATRTGYFTHFCKVWKGPTSGPDWTNSIAAAVSKRGSQPFRFLAHIAASSSWMVMRESVVIELSYIYRSRRTLSFPTTIP